MAEWPLPHSRMPSSGTPELSVIMILACADARPAKNISIRSAIPSL
ncbi:MAG: hypothetical protein ACKOCO_02690 [Bacteroidota bacterium]